MKNLNILLQDIAQLLELSSSKEESINRGLDYYLELEHNSYYGGYRLVNVNITNGGHSGAFNERASCSRRSLKEMTAYLNGIYNGVKFAREKTKKQK